MVMLNDLSINNVCNSTCTDILTEIPCSVVIGFRTNIGSVTYIKLTFEATT